MDDFNNDNQPQESQGNQQPQDQQQNPYVQQPQDQQQVPPYAQQGYQPQQQDPYAQPAYYQQPDQSAYYPQPEVKGKSGMSIASMVLGIVSIVFFCAWYLSGPMAIVSIILGAISLKKKKAGKGMSIAGIICASVGLILAIAMMIFAIYVIQHPELGTTDFWESYIQENS